MTNQSSCCSTTVPEVEAPESLPLTSSCCSTTSAPEAEAPESLPVASNCCGGGTHSVLGYEK